MDFVQTHDNGVVSVTTKSCPSCKSEEVLPNHNFCPACGLALQQDVMVGVVLPPLFGVTP